MIKIKLMVNCPLCQSNFESLQQHIQKCNMKHLISANFSNRLLFVDNREYCKRCKKVFQNRINFRYHAKTCKRDSQKTSTVRQYKTIEEDNADLSKNFTTVKKIKKNQYEENSESKWQLKNQILTLTSTVLSFTIEQWCQKNSLISKPILLKVYQNFLLKCQDNLQKQIPFIQFSTLYKIDHKIKWNQIFRTTSELFYKNVILDRTKNIPEKQKLRLFKALNKIYSLYNDAFPKFQLPKAEYLSEKATLPLRYKDFVDMVLILFQQKKKGYIQFGAQLLIFLQSRMRFPSMLHQVQAGVQIILRQRQKNKDINSTFVIDKKTKKKQELILSFQLLLLLQKIQWHKFSQPQRFYVRIYEYLPFSLYSIRKTFFTMLFLIIPNTEHLTTYTNHSSFQNARFYIKQQQRAEYVKIINQYCFLQFIKVEGQKQGVTFCERFNQRQLQCVQILGNWFSEFLKQTRKLVFNQAPINILKQQYSTDAIEEIINKETHQEIIEQQQNLTQKQEQQILQAIVLNGITYYLKNGLLTKDQLFVPNQAGICYKCQSHGQNCLSCRFCQLLYHDKCVVFLCDCYQSASNQQQKKIHLKSENLATQKMKMPSQYFVENKQKHDQIKAIIYLRGFKYCSSYVLTPKAVNDLSFILDKINPNDYQSQNFNNYQKYRLYQYFPPLRVGIYGLHNEYGTGLGLFATQKIPANTFLGEYSADAYLRMESHTVKRQDCQISLIQITQALHRSLDFGPISFCGYGILINQSKRPNCAFKKCIINGGLVIAIYTIQIIYPDAQLYVDYDLKTSQIIEENHLIQVDNQRVITSKMIGVKNKGNTCYISAALQLLKKIFPYVFTEVQDKFSFEMSKFISLQNEAFDPEVIVNLMSIRTSQFKRFIQGDYGSAFLFLFNQILQQNEQLDDPLSLVQKTSVQCSRCSTITYSNEKCSMVDLYSHEIVLNTEQTIGDFDCKTCKQKVSAVIIRKYTQFNKFLLFQFKRYGPNGEKLLYDGYTPQSIEVEGKKYIKSFYVIHIGTSMINGHYKVVNVRNKLMFDDDIVSKKYTINVQEIYATLYEKT